MKVQEQGVKLCTQETLKKQPLVDLGTAPKQNTHSSLRASSLIGVRLDFLQTLQPK